MSDEARSKYWQAVAAMFQSRAEKNGRLADAALSAVVMLAKLVDSIPEELAQSSENLAILDSYDAIIKQITEIIQ